MHITFHIKDHWLNNYEWYRKSKILQIKDISAEEIIRKQEIERFLS